jgi:hypothetical protein
MASASFGRERRRGRRGTGDAEARGVMRVFGGGRAGVYECIGPALDWQFD